MIVLEDDSPYPEVRAAVANTDDVDMPASTLRSWVIGVAFAILVPGLDSPSSGPVFVRLTAHPRT